MALLAFESSPAAPQSIVELLLPAQRLKTAGEVNAAILESLSQGKDAKLVGLLKLLCWGETMLEEKADFPKVSFRRGRRLRALADGWSVVSWTSGKAPLPTRVSLALLAVRIFLFARAAFCTFMTM